MINTNGRLSLAKTEEGALYWFGHKEKVESDTILNYTGTANDSFTTSIWFLPFPIYPSNFSSFKSYTHQTCFFF